MTTHMTEIALIGRAIAQIAAFGRKQAHIGHLDTKKLHPRYAPATQTPGGPSKKVKSLVGAVR